MDRKRHVCASVSCATAEKYDADRLCSGCRSTFYCSPECQGADWKGHKAARKVATAEREASQIVRVGKGGGSAPAAAAPERVGHPASQWVADAARGEAEALCRLAVCYYEGEGVPKSYERAKELAQQAAAKGHAIAQGCLGDLHREGKGVPQSYERAAEFYQKAAVQGNALAQVNLGDLYRNGVGVPQSYERAAEFYKLGAAKGHAGAQRCLGMLYCEGKGVSQDVARGVALFKKAAAGGDKEADVLRKLG
jgi:TPR repeat protein